MAIILLVSAVEAILSPTRDWRKERPVARFVKAVDEYVPDIADEILNHANFVLAFGYAPRGTQERRHANC